MIQNIDTIFLKHNLAFLCIYLSVEMLQRSHRNAVKQLSHVFDDVAVL